jgi:hypothetical protein
MAEMFENKRTGAKAAELRAYRTEDESEAKRRLEAAGWSFDVDYEFEDFTFRVKKDDAAPKMDAPEVQD